MMRISLCGLNITVFALFALGSGVSSPCESKSASSALRFDESADRSKLFTGVEVFAALSCA